MSIIPQMTHTPARPRPSRAVVIASAALALPVALFVALKLNPAWDVQFGNGTIHFYVVSAVAAFAAVLAAAVLVAARRLPAARTLFLGMAFLSMATIFLAHGLGTSPFFGPGHVHQPAGPTQTHQSSFNATTVTGQPRSYGLFAGQAAPVQQQPGPGFFARLRVVGYSAQLSLFVSALFFFLAVVDIPDRLSAWLSRRQYWLATVGIALLAGHVVVALWFPTLLSPLPLNHERIAYVVGGVATAGFLFAGWRFYQAYRLALLPIQGALAFAMVLLAEAQWSMLLGDLWYLSWWEYHFLMLAGFMVGVVGLLNHYRITGDLGAIVEGLFLRKQVHGIESGDPRAIVALGAAVAAKDSETAEHIERVGDLSVAMGQKLWLPSERLLVLRWAGRLHDVGKIGVPNAILRKPGRLTPDEFEAIKLHSLRGWEIARHSGLLREAAATIRAHHERLDGSGYPDGLRGPEISTEARIVAVADVWDALTSDRPYRAGMSEQEAADILLESVGHHLDRDCVEALFTILGLQRYQRQVNLAAHNRAA
jgi:HD-GYP domain-containing protein (c-di-GMP phosphodiesterase class II)